jgi:uncharacterized protein YcsI (UPF0317 family)
MAVNEFSDIDNLTRADGAAVRRAARSGALSGPTAGLARGFQQGNIVILPAALADDFLRFCVRNPKPAPILGVSEPGDPSLPGLGPDIDIRRDVPRYRIFRNGEHAETVTDLDAVWRDDFVTFVLGCSFSFETALVRDGIPVRHVEAGRNVRRRTRSARSCCRPGCPRPMARRSISATPPPLASPISASRNMATPPTCAPATCRCSGPAG